MKMFVSAMALLGFIAAYAPSSEVYAQPAGGATTPAPASVAPAAMPAAPTAKQPTHKSTKHTAKKKSTSKSTKSSTSKKTPEKPQSSLVPPPAGRVG